MKLKTIKLFIAVLCVLLFGVGNAMAGTLKVAAGATSENFGWRSNYSIYTSNWNITLPGQEVINQQGGALYYDADEHRLLFNGVHRKCVVPFETFFIYSEPLTIELRGENELTIEQEANWDAKIFSGNIKIIGDGSLKLYVKSYSRNYCVSAVEAIDMQGTGVVEIYLSNAKTYRWTYAVESVNLQEGMILSTNHYYAPPSTSTDNDLSKYIFRKNGGLKYSRSDEYTSYWSYDDGGAQWIRIEPLRKYNLYVAGQQVNLENVNDVLGDGHVSYYPANNQLTLNNANIHYEYNGSGYKPNVFNYSYIDYPDEHITGIDPSTFKVELKGRNTVTGVVNIATGASFRGFMQNCTFVGDGTLEMDLSANVEAPGVYGFSTQGSGRNKSVTLDPSFTGWVSVSVSNVGSKPAAVFETADCQLILPNTTDYFVAKSSTLPVVALTPATTNTNLYVAHVNFGYKGASAAPTATITNQNLLTGTAYVGKKLDDETCGLSVTGGQAPFYYTATNLQNGLSINPETGFVSGTYTTATSAISLAKTTTITATDVQGRQTSVSVTRQAVAEKLTINGAMTEEPKWAQGIAIEQISLSEKISGGLAPYTYKVLDATSILGNTRLPAGVLLNTSTGIISGTPTAKGTYKCAIEVTDALGQKAGILVQGNVAVNYGFSVAGVPVTGLNRNNIPVSGKTSGTISYDPATETLVFDNVEINTTSASTSYFVDSKISKIKAVGKNIISYTGAISGVNEYYGFPGDLEIYGDGDFRFRSGRVGPNSYAVNGNVTIMDNATIMLASYYAAINGTLTIPMNQVIYTGNSTGTSVSEWNKLNGISENMQNYLYKYVKTEKLSRGALCFSDKKEGKTIYNTVPVKPFTMFDVKGGVAPYSYSATSLPSGLVIDAKTGYISGTSTLGNKDVTVNFTVTDAMGREINTDMNLTLKNPTLTVTAYGGSKGGHSAGTYSWATAANTSLEVGQILLVESNFDLDETAIEVPKNIVLRDVNGKMLAGDIDLKDGVKYAFPYEVEAQSVSYTRSFSDKVAGKWQCLYVPFDITVTEELLKDFEFAKLYMISYKDANNNGEIEDGEPLVMLLMKQAEGKVLHANTPYFIKAKTAGTKSIQVESATLKPVENGTVYCCTTEHEYTLTGINNTFNVIGNYTLNTSGQFSYYTVNQNIKPNRWYMQVNSLTGADDENAAKARQIILMVDGEDDTTGIMDITSGSKTSTAEGIFTLDGRKINETENLSRGIYIKNGKKIMVK